MELEDVIKSLRLLMWLSLLLIGGCNGSYNFEIDDASEKRNFRPHVRGLSSEYYTMHIVGELDGTAELHLLDPNFDFSKGPFCSDYHEKLDSGKVDKYVRGDFYLVDVEPNLFYMPCTAKKGHLTIEIAFNKDLRN